MITVSWRCSPYGEHDYIIGESYTYLEISMWAYRNFQVWSNIKTLGNR